MRKLSAVFLVAASLSCGPLCNDTSMESGAVNSCASSAGAGSAGFCQCAMDYLFARHTCDEFDKGSVTVGQIYEACYHCAATYTNVSCDLGSTEPEALLGASDLAVSQ